MKISIDDALIYSLYLLESKKEKPTFSDLVVTAYKSFPELFQLVGYPNYPDSTRIDKSWRRCRTDKLLIEGNQNTRFYLTHAGKVLALEVAKKVGAFAFDRNKSLDSRSREGKLLLRLKKRDVFQKYLRTKELPLNKFILKETLGLTPETPTSTIISVLDELLSAAKTYSDAEAIEFLNKIRPIFRR